MNARGLPILVQATNISSFPEKVLQELAAGRTVLGYLLKRLTDFWNGPVVLAATELPEDGSLVAEAERYGVKSVRGDHRNVAARLAKAAESLGCGRFVRVNANYPLLDLQAMARLAEAHEADGAVLSHNEHGGGVPWGMGCDVVEASVLRRLLEMDLTDVQLESPGLCIRQNPDVFKVQYLDAPVSRPQVKLILETEKDLDLLRAIALQIPDPDLESVVAYLDEHPFAAASNIEEPAKEVGLDKLYLHPGKIAALHNGKLGTDELYPVSVELSLTNRCNLRCVWCSDSDLRERQGVDKDLTAETLFALFDDLKAGGTRGVVVEGGGEPTIHKDFKAVVQRLRAIGLQAGLITNGTRPLDQETLASLEWIRVSLDASTPHEFSKLKGRDFFDKVLDNIADYARHCPTVGIGYVVTLENASNLETLVLRARRTGVSYIQFRPVVDCPDLYPKGLDLTFLKRYETASFSVMVDGMRENATTGNSGLPCLAHSLTTVISGDGGVYLCGRLNIHDWLPPMGNIRHQSFRDIWLGEERRRQAGMVLDADFCQANCPQCRLSKFNVLYDRLSKIRTPNFI